MEKILGIIEHLSPQSRETIKALTRQLCEIENINVPLEPAQGLQALAEGVPLWEAWLVGQSFSQRSVELYTYYVNRHLKKNNICKTSERRRCYQ